MCRKSGALHTQIDNQEHGQTPGAVTAARICDFCPGGVADADVLLSLLLTKRKAGSGQTSNQSV